MDLDTRESQVFLAIVSFVVWTTLCALVESNITFKSLAPKVDHDVKNRFVGIIHGLLTCILAGYNVFHDQPSYTDKNSDLQIFILLISMGYFVYDYLACVYYGIADKALAIHHSLGVIGYLSGIYANNSTLAICGIFYGECSNSSMHIRALLRIFGKRHTLIHELFDFLYLTIYIIARGVFVTNLAYNAVLISEIPLFLRIACCGLWAQSALFIKEMVFILKRKRLQIKERQKKGIPYFWFTENLEIKKLSYFKKDAKEAIF